MSLPISKGGKKLEKNAINKRIVEFYVLKVTLNIPHKLSPLKQRGLLIHSLTYSQWRTQEFFRGGGQRIQLRTEGRQNGDLGVVAP